MRSLLAALTLALLLGAPASAIVGGSDAPAGRYPAVANVTIAGAFGCTGTLVAPDWVLTAGHCSSLTGAGGVATPAAYPPAAFRVVVGTVARSGAGGESLTVDRVVVPRDYLLTSGFDTSLLHLTRAARTAPTPVAGLGHESLWRPGVLADVAGFGATAEGGQPPDTLQEVRIPIVADAICAARYTTYEPSTQLCAGYPEGGRDSCQGDSGGPVFSRTASGTPLLVGATSYGEGCGRPNTPGVYARLSDRVLREFVRGVAPAAVVDASAGVAARPVEGGDRRMPAGGSEGPVAPSSVPDRPSAPAAAQRGGLRVTLTADRALRARRLLVRVGCSAACGARIVLRVDARTARRSGLRSRTVARATTSRATAGRSTVVLRLTRRTALALRGRRGAVLGLQARVVGSGAGTAVSLGRRVVLADG